MKRIERYKVLFLCALQCIHAMLTQSTSHSCFSFSFSATNRLLLVLSLSLSHSQTHIHTYITPQLRCTWVRGFSFYSFMLRMGLKLVCMMTIRDDLTQSVYSFISSLLTTLRIFKRRLSCDWWNKLISFKLCALFSKYLYNN